VLAV
jgi:hypothetical protein